MKAKFVITSTKRKIEAIKLYRVFRQELDGVVCTLKEAKEFIDYLPAVVEVNGYYGVENEDCPISAVKRFYSSVKEFSDSYLEFSFDEEEKEEIIRNEEIAKIREWFDALSETDQKMVDLYTMYSGPTA
tara:strand:+ start:1819 stop:2205 length:387 start_codon:yes stop_codon:yes gene_type:complete